MEEQLLEFDLKTLAVFLIDMQDKFIDTNEKRSLIPNQISVLNFCENKNVPILVFRYHGYGDINYKLQEKLNKIHKLVTYFSKRNDDAFHLDSLERWLENYEIKTILIMGINACACVLETAKSAIYYGYNVITSDQLIAGYCNECNGKHFWYEKNGVFRKDLAYLLNVESS
ncbi:hypothetical protein A3C57_02285 [Candidatus Nomurabacteria bacterium RIFCSPHIGHO2_02_FULL_33_12]|nr:MAG: hypothetical protein A3C57_02285 [Candidatus Nomurabacteria bacterium RIFCSPHIGHO2_02_FULL_33_12]